MHKIKCRYRGQPAPVIILFICSRHYWVCIMVGPCKRPHVDCPGNPRHSVLLEQLWSVCMQLRPAQVGQHLCWSSVGRTAALHREAQACSPAGILLSGPAVGGCDGCSRSDTAPRCFVTQCWGWEQCEMVGGCC